MNPPRSRGLSAVRRLGFLGLGAVEWTWLAASVLGVWELLTRTIATSLFIPPVSQILNACVHNWLSPEASNFFLSSLFRENVFPSLGRLAAGYAIAAVGGISIGIVLGVWRAARAFCAPLVRLAMSVPATILLPLAIVLLGVDSSMNIFLIAVGSTWPMVINTCDGVRSIDDAAVLTARSLHLGRMRYFRSVLLPGASPAIFAGMRVSLGIGLVLMIISELYAATSGIGYYIVIQQRLFQFVNLWSALFLVAFFGILFNALFALVERYALAWHTAARATAGGAVT